MKVKLFFVSSLLICLLSTACTRNTRNVTCTLTGKATQQALGEVYVFRVNKTESLKLQKSRCINMDDIVIGETFESVMVFSNDGTLQCIVNTEAVD